MHITDEAASCVAVAAMVDMGGLDEDATRMMRLRLILWFSSQSTKVAFERCARAAEDIERNNAIDQEAMEQLASEEKTWVVEMTYVSTIGIPSTSASSTGL